MVRICHVPSFSRGVFTANELSGWADGVAYTPRKIKRCPECGKSTPKGFRKCPFCGISLRKPRKKKADATPTAYNPPPVKPIDGLTEL